MFREGWVCWNHGNPPSTERIIMKAWHNDPHLKAEVLSRMLQHRAEDSIIQGLYQEVDPQAATGYRGCLIGCTLPRKAGDWLRFNRHSEYSWHREVEKQYGIPTQVAILLDNTFERLAVDKAPWFAVAFIEATPVGADMDQVVKQLEQDFLDRYHRGKVPSWYAGDDVWVDDPAGIANLVTPTLDRMSLTKIALYYQDNALWVAQQIIKRVREADPNPLIPFETVADVEEDVRVPVAA
jgi:hypothetical protein